MHQGGGASFDELQFQKIKTDGEVFYKSLGSVFSAYFNEHVFFTSEGLAHLKFKKKFVARLHEDQKVRFQLLKFVPEVLKLSRTIQDVCETKSFERIQINSRNEFRLVNVTFYEFIAVLHGWRIKVIVKQIENNKKIFWSVIPFWGKASSAQTTEWQ